MTSIKGLQYTSNKNNEVSKISEKEIFNAEDKVYETLKMHFFLKINAKDKINGQ